MLEQGGGGFDPKLMMGLSMLLNPDTDIVSMLGQMQQQQQYMAQQQLAAQKFALDRVKLASELRKDQMDVDKRNTEVKEGQGFSENVVGYEPTSATGWKGKGLLGDNYELFNHPLYNQGTQAQFGIEPYMGGKTKFDPITRARIVGSGHIARTGDVAKAHDALPEAPKPFTLNPGQVQFDPQGRKIAEVVDKDKLTSGEASMAKEFANATQSFDSDVQNYARFNAMKQDTDKGNDPIKDIGAATLVLKLMAPSMKTNPETGTVSITESDSQAQQLAQQINNMIKTNGVLSPQMRKFVYDAGDALFQSQIAGHQQKKEFFTKRAIAAGYNPEHVILDYRVDDKEPAPQQPPQVSDAGFAARDAKYGLAPGTSKAEMLKKTGQGR